MQFETLQDVYDNVSMWSNNAEVTYRDYTLRKVDWSHPEHDEVALINPDGKEVESLTVGAFDTYDAFEQRVDEVIDYDPDDMDDWLDR